MKDLLMHVYNEIKRRWDGREEKIIFIVDKITSTYLFYCFILNQLGYKTEIQEWEEDCGEQVRRADVLADWVYIEGDKKGDLPLRKEKRLDGKNCRNVGIGALLNWKEFSSCDKHIAIMGKDVDLASDFIARGATVTMINSLKGINLKDVDLLIVLPEWQKKVNCYPLYIPVIDCGGRCINTEDREVIKDSYLLNILGVLLEIW